MTRVKRGIISSERHKKLREATAGYRGTKSKLTKVAREALLHAGEYAFHGRKRKKRDFRRLWITRISEASKELGISYSVLIKKLSDKQIILDRKILSNIVTEDPETFKTIISAIK